MITPKAFHRFEHDFFVHGMFNGQRYGQAFLNHFHDLPEVAAQRSNPDIWEERHPHIVLEILIQLNIVPRTIHFEVTDFKVIKHDDSVLLRDGSMTRLVDVALKYSGTLHKSFEPNFWFGEKHAHIPSWFQNGKHFTDENKDVVAVLERIRGS